jgi:tetratricopeptide (TPR) repeat protein
MTNSAAVEHLLCEGLNLYAHGKYNEAIKRWREVLRIQPNNQTTIEYLNAVSDGDHRKADVGMLIDRGLNFYGLGDYGRATNEWLQGLMFDPENIEIADFLASVDLKHLPQYAIRERIEPDRLIRAMELRSPHSDGADNLGKAALENGAAFSVETVKVEILKLLNIHDFDMALELIDELLESNYVHPDLLRSKRIICSRMILKYVKRLGGEYQLPRIDVDKQEFCKTDSNYELCYLLGLIDGRTSIADIISISPLGRFKTYRYLWQLVDTKVATLIDPQVSPDRLADRLNKYQDRGSQ